MKKQATFRHVFPLSYLYQDLTMLPLTSVRLEPWELVESERLLKEEWEQKVVNLTKFWPHFRFSLRASNVVGAAVEEEWEQKVVKSTFPVKTRGC
ncbi:hypothetical protein Dsin_013878 [Dipteronia sinensis]|uniref:Uncharacterized protein n=1 Tax=Dipteronia sinensis TaxID=43782 RepID=A0AAE0E9A3_9ROSI|nr:hypothetical protein Dsin_013878 [Dipteronia sinensis]